MSTTIDHAQAAGHWLLTIMINIFNANKSEVLHLPSSTMRTSGYRRIGRPLQQWERMALMTYKPTIMTQSPSLADTAARQSVYADWDILSLQAYTVPDSDYSIQSLGKCASVGNKSPYIYPEAATKTS